MSLDAQLNWSKWKFGAADGPIEFQITTNPDTGAAIKFFWYLNDEKLPVDSVVCHAYEKFILDPAKVTGNVNRIGFVFIAQPRVPTTRDVYVTVEGRQPRGAGTTFAQPYTHSLNAGEAKLQMSDGITVVTG